MKQISIEELKETYLLGELEQGIYRTLLDCYDYDSIDSTWSYSEMYRGKW